MSLVMLGRTTPVLQQSAIRRTDSRRGLKMAPKAILHNSVCM